MNILNISYEKYWASQHNGLCPECGQELDVIKDKCCKVCHKCWWDNKWDEINIGEAE